MTSITYRYGNTFTTVVDLTEGLGGRTTEELLELSHNGKIREFSETLEDGRVVTYSLEVKEEILEEELDMEIASSRQVTTCSSEVGGVVDTLMSVVEDEEITVQRSFSRSVSREDETIIEVLKTEEKEFGGRAWVEISRKKAVNIEEDCMTTMPTSKTFVTENGVMITEL